MSILTLNLPTPHSGQRTWRNHSRRFNVGACGRRWGKTTFFQELAIHPALLGHPVGWFAPSYKLLLEAWRVIELTVQPILKRSNVKDRRMELITGGTIEFWTLEDSDAGRSRKYKRIIIDEAGLVRRLLDVWHQALRPTLADLVGDAYIGGTPKGRNDFWELWQRGHSQGTWHSYHAPTENNPHIAPDEIAAMRESMPALVAAQELDAEFTEGELTLFAIGDIDRAFDSTSPQPKQPNRRYVTAIDVGRRRDATIINTFDVTERPYRRVAFDRLERVAYPAIQARIEARAKAYGGVTIVESNGIGDPLIENLNVPVQPFTTTAKSKLQGLQALQMLFEQDWLRADWDSRERAALLGCAWDNDHTADEVMSLAIFALHAEPPMQQVISHYAKLAKDAA